MMQMHNFAISCLANGPGICTGDYYPLAESCGLSYLRCMLNELKSLQKQQYRKNPKILDTQKFAVITLKD